MITDIVVMVLGIGFAVATVVAIYQAFAQTRSHDLSPPSHEDEEQRRIEESAW